VVRHTLVYTEDCDSVLRDLPPPPAGNVEELETSGDSTDQNGEGSTRGKQMLQLTPINNSSQRKHTNLQRTRSAELH
jgi:hypothetical protein